MCIRDRSKEGDDRIERTTCEIVGPAFVIVDPDATRGHFCLRLTSGVLDASVVKLEPDEEFELRTPHASVRVVGTRFRVEVGEGKTSLWVREGTVELTGLDAQANDAPVKVPAGKSWAIGAQGHPERIAWLQGPEVDPEVEPTNHSSATGVPPIVDDAETPEPSSPLDLPAEVGKEANPTRPLLNGSEADLDTPVSPGAPPPTED